MSVPGHVRFHHEGDSKVWDVACASLFDTWVVAAAVMENLINTLEVY